MAVGVRACVVASILLLLQEACLLPRAEGIQGLIQDDHGISLLNELLQNDPSSLCRYVSCQEPSSVGHCPQGTLYMPNIGQFGCCGACVRFRQNGEHCTGSIDPMYGGGYGYVQLGSKAASLAASLGGKPVDNVVDSLWCDYHLLCSEMFQSCEMNTQVKDCLTIQRLYDQAVESDDFLYYRDDYRWRPDCSPDGNYREKQCKGPQGEMRCVCVDPNGERLYGAAYPYQKELYESMNCKCSRRVWERLHDGESSVTLHCTENGNYEPLQCEDGWCYCMDPDTATPYGNRLPEKAVHFLPCYNKTLMGEQYLRRCESEYHGRMEINDLMAFKGVQGPSTLLNCDPDGSYGSRQCDTDMCRCYDKYKVDALSFPAGPGCRHAGI
ncbi:uncharacterized protein [Panulirus ornatus]|uniref:uncharacterized protein isoform X2 n=1 Tax=Panulirus ornatus TaxID=150431 RepID=UPI003A8851FC